jgi:hypothetical protein
LAVELRDPALAESGVDEAILRFHPDPPMTGGPQALVVTSNHDPRSLSPVDGSPPAEPTLHPRLDPDQIPWLADEPTGKIQPTVERSGNLSPLEANMQPEAATPPASFSHPGVGARVEIVIAPSSSVIPSDAQEYLPGMAGPMIASRPSLPKKLLWWLNLFFDSTIGTLLPGLRRAKWLLGLIGIGLLAASLILAFRAWMP